MKEKVKSEMISAMKSKDKERLSILRLISAKLDEALKINEKAELVSVLDSMIKERNKSIEAYVNGGREDLAETERYEVGVINEFLPKRMSIEEIGEVVSEVITQTGASSMKDMGKVMGMVKGKLGNSAKPSDIANVVKSKLSLN
jgi:uncharacterized protein YqeY